MRLREDGARSDPKYYLDLLVVNLHPLHQSPQDDLARLPVQVVEPVSDGSRKVGHLPNDQTQLAFLGSGLSHSARLGFQMGDPLFEPRDAGLKFVLLNQPLGITVDQTSDSLAQPSHLALQHGQVRLPYLLVGTVQAPLLFPHESLWFFQQRPNLVPDRGR